MKRAEAERIMREGQVPQGYMVMFEHVDGSCLHSDHFPDKLAGEPLYETEMEAWEVAKAFAAKTYGRCVNIYVADNNFSPVRNFPPRLIRNRE